MLPDIKSGCARRKTVQTEFGGLDLRPEAGDGTIGEMYGLDPAKAPRLGAIAAETTLHAVLGARTVLGLGDHLLYVMGTSLLCDGWTVCTLNVPATGTVTLVPFGRRIIVQESKELVELGTDPKGRVLSADLLPEGEEGEAWLVGSGDNPTVYVYSGGQWTEAGPVKKALEASVTVREVSIGAGTYQGEAAAMNTISADVDFSEYFAPGDAVTITGCTGQPMNNQTVIVRELVKAVHDGVEHSLGFYENSFRFPMFGVLKYYESNEAYIAPGDFFQVGGEVPEAAKGAVFFFPPDVQWTKDSMLVVWDPNEWTQFSGQTVPVTCDFYQWDSSKKKYVKQASKNPAVEEHTVIYSVELHGENEAFPGMGENEETMTPELDGYGEKTITITRAWPELEEIFACNNRLWGRNGHTIRASKLGDPTNWNVFDGLADDSWALELGEADMLTGGINHNGVPTFYSQTARYKVYGDRPAAYQVSTQLCDGVRRDCGKSLTVMGDAAYYVSRVGVMIDTGYIPQRISEALGPLRLRNAAAMGRDGVLFLRGEDETGRLWALRYLTERGTWWAEERPGARSGETVALAAFGACTCELRSIRIVPVGNVVECYLIQGEAPSWSNPQAETRVVSGLTTNEFTVAQPNRKRVHRIQLRLRVEAYTAFETEIQYDDGDWARVYTVTPLAETRTSIYIPILPHRCDRFRLRFSGAGFGWEIESLALELRDGSAIF